MTNLITPPDWSNDAPTVTLAQVPDLGEVAARLGAPLTYSRTGRVLRLFNMTYASAQLALNVDHPDSTAEASTTRAHSGSTSVYLATRAAAASWARVKGWNAYTSRSRIGVQFLSNLVVIHNYVEFYLKVVVNGTAYYGSIRATAVEDEHVEWSVYHSGDYVTLANIPAVLNLAYLWHQMKIVVDPSDWSYVRFILDGVEYDLSDYALTATDTTTGYYVEFYCQLNGVDDAVNYLYVDDIVVSEEEP